MRFLPRLAFGLLVCSSLATHLSCGRDKPPSSNILDDVDHVELTIEPAKLGRAISPLIYGYTGIDQPERYGVASIRAGGSRFTTYNWENNASNGGGQSMFQSDGYLVAGSEMPDAPGEALRPILETAAGIGAAAIVTIPNVDYVAADKNPGVNVVETAPDYLATRFVQNHASKPTDLSTTPDTADGVVYQDEFVSWVTGNFSDTPLLFSMDNEPDLWSRTHKEVHPDSVTYDEVVRRNTEFATAVKSVWEWGPVLGFVGSGWQGFVDLNGAPDAPEKGDFIDYYLRQMKAAEDDVGVRLINYLDLHWYPEAEGLDATGKSVRIVGGDADGSSGVIEARVQAPRSLWDPAYREQSWIVAAAGDAIALIPRMRRKIQSHYPGTRLAMTEWNYGGGQDISGGVATCDVLGIFGREGVDVANIRPLAAAPVSASDPEAFTLAAISVYRNYDGAGAGFGDTSISAQTSSVYSASVYASVDSTNPARLVIVAINKRSAPTTATVRIVGESTSVGAAVWVLAGMDPGVRAAGSLIATAPGVFQYAMPALSVSVLVPDVVMADRQ